MNHKGAEDTETLREKIDDFIYDIRNDLRTLRRDIRYKQRVFRNRVFGKTYQTTLKEILVTGKFGGLEASMTAEYTACSMGEPDWGRDNFRNSEFEFWSYGKTEVFFHKDSQSLFYYKIPLQHEYKNWLPVNVVWNGYFPKAGTTLAEFEDYLKREALEYVVLWDGTQDVRWPNVYTVSGKISTLFCEDTLEIIGIYVHPELMEFKSHVASHIAQTIFDILNEYVEHHRIGKVFYGYTAKLGITEDVRLSVSYTAGRRPNQRYELSVPDLGVVVARPHTDMEELLSIINRFFYSQTKEFWIVFPATQQLHQHKGSAPNEVRIYRDTERIETDLFPDIEGLTTDAIFNLPQWAMKDEA